MRLLNACVCFSVAYIITLRQCHETYLWHHGPMEGILHAYLILIHTKTMSSCSFKHIMKAVILVNDLFCVGYLFCADVQNEWPPY